MGTRLHELSKEGKWTELPKLLTDDMLEEWAVIATYDDLAKTLKERCAGLFTTVLLDLPAKLRADEDRVRSIVADLHAG